MGGIGEAEPIQHGLGDHIPQPAQDRLELFLPLTTQSVGHRPVCAHAHCVMKGIDLLGKHVSRQRHPVGALSPAADSESLLSTGAAFICRTSSAAIAPEA